MNKITTAARRIAKSYNQAIKRSLAGNGQLVFDTDGTGGAWYSNNARISSSLITLGLGYKKITQKEAQTAIDMHEWNRKLNEKFQQGVK